MKRSVILGLMGAIINIVLSVGAFPAGVSADESAKLDAHIKKAMAEWGVPGLAIAVVKDGKVAYSKGFGVREVGKEDPVDEDTIFAIGSTTKAFTTTALGLLVQDGKISWRDRVTDHLPGFQMYDPYVTREIMVCDLVSNRAGLGSQSDFLWYGTDLDRNEIIKRLRYIKNDFSFRSEFGYSNGMFLTGGQVIPAVTGMSWDDFVKERIFDPLGMTRSNTSVRDLQGLTNVATPHMNIDDKVSWVTYRNIDNAAPAGAINSSIKDMTQWVMLQLGKGNYRGGQIVDETVIEETHRPYTPIPLTPEVTKKTPQAQFSHFLNYCLGWLAEDYKGYMIVWHNGEIDGMKAFVGLVPEEDLGAVILTNYGGHNMHEALFFHVVDLFLNLTPQDWNALYLESWREKKNKEKEVWKELEEARVKDTNPTLPLIAYEGTYRNDAFGEIKVALEDGQLVIYYSSSLIGDLEHWNYDTFMVNFRDKAAGATELKPPVGFSVDAKGSVAEMNYDDMFLFARLPDASIEHSNNIVK